MSMNPRNKLTRREFLAATTATAATASVGAWAAEIPASKPAASQPAQPLLPAGVLGRTRYPVTRISFGTVRLSEKSDVRLVRRIIDSGINLLHTATNYAGGKSIAIVGEVFKADKSYRERVLLCLKNYNPEKDSELDNALKTLNTDHVDLLLPELHQADPARLDLIRNAQDRLKKKGKIRFAGFVCHQDVLGVTRMVLEKTPRYFDAGLLAMPWLPATGNPKSGETDPAQREQLLNNVRQLRQNGLGLLSMKSGAREAVGQGVKIFQPHAKSVLAAGADTVLTSITTRDELEMIRKLDLKDLKLSSAEQEAAERFQRSRSSACLMCGSCAKACPRHLPVGDLMRVRLYHEAYGWPEHAGAEFARLGVSSKRWRESCGDCNACAQVCPVGLAGSETIRRVAGYFA